MSRHARAALLLGFVALPLEAQESLPAEPASVSAGAQPSAEQAIADAKEVFGPPRPQKKACTPTAPGEEIVVCAEEQEQSQFRIRTDKQVQDEYAKRTMNKGSPRPPDLEPQYPGVVVGRGCFIPPCPPPKAVMIDLKAIPEAPAGSDADRVGRGLAPIGAEGHPAAPAIQKSETAPAVPVNSPGSASPEGQQ